MENYEIICPIGKGAFSTVYKANDKKASKVVAIKISQNIKLERSDNPLVSKFQIPYQSTLDDMSSKGKQNKLPFNMDSFKTKNLLLREFNILSKVNSPNILTVHGYFQEGLYNYLVLEYANNGDLLTYLNNLDILDEDTIKSFFKQICLGVKYLHDNNIIHGDIKLENILLFKKSLENEIAVKLADFGFSTEFSLTRKRIYTYGSPIYTAPEIILGVEVFGPEVDIWSLGVVLYCMLYKETPLTAENGIIKAKSYLKLGVAGPKFKKPYSNECEKLLTLMFNLSPILRINITDIIKSSWVSPPFKLDLSKLLSRRNSSKLGLTEPSSPLNTGSPVESPIPGYKS